jgi:thiol-disulfide isomerase/thioredoxin
MSSAVIGAVILAVVSPAIAVSKDPRPVDLMFKDMKGQKVHLREYRGKVVVLNFWATWCVPCKAEMPMLVEAEKEYAKRGVVFVAASLDERQTRPKIPDFIAKFNIDFPVWVGASTMDLDDLKLGQGLPATAFLDREGRIVSRILGQARAEEVKERLDWLTGEKAGPAPLALVKHLE